MSISADINPKVIPYLIARAMLREFGVFALKLAARDDGRYFDYYMHWVKLLYG